MNDSFALLVKNILLAFYREPYWLAKSYTTDNRPITFIQKLNDRLTKPVENVEVINSDNIMTVFEAQSDLGQ